MVADEASPSVNGVFENVNTDEVKINYFHNDWNDTCVCVCVCRRGGRVQRGHAAARRVLECKGLFSAPRSHLGWNVFLLGNLMSGVQ